MMFCTHRAPGLFSSARDGVSPGSTTLRYLLIIRVINPQPIDYLRITFTGEPPEHDGLMTVSKRGYCHSLESNAE